MFSGERWGRCGAPQRPATTPQPQKADVDWAAWGAPARCFSGGKAGTAGRPWIPAAARVGPGSLALVKAGSAKGRYT